ncbi:unnamed protein product [Prorocentrum cordatum]|uniref:Uncharacterized protein n=1 Tax=Prorocentrum cordatum TaxID=2364126 RepID=A0ABN9WG79_9DINO|nr:unnamed protein product [Polarella glacialis]
MVTLVAVIHVCLQAQEILGLAGGLAEDTCVPLMPPKGFHDVGSLADVILPCASEPDFVNYHEDEEKPINRTRAMKNGEILKAIYGLAPTLNIPGAVIKMAITKIAESKIEDSEWTMSKEEKKDMINTEAEAEGEETEKGCDIGAEVKQTMAKKTKTGLKEDKNAANSAWIQALEKKDIYEYKWHEDENKLARRKVGAKSKIIEYSCQPFRPDGADDLDPAVVTFPDGSQREVPNVLRGSLADDSTDKPKKRGPLWEDGSLRIMRRKDRNEKILHNLLDTNPALDTPNVIMINSGLFPTPEESLNLMIDLAKLYKSGKTREDLDRVKATKIKQLTEAGKKECAVRKRPAAAAATEASTPITANMKRPAAATAAEKEPTKVPKTITEPQSSKLVGLQSKQDNEDGGHG